MKYSLLILLILLISSSSSPCEDKTSASSSKDCKDLAVETGDKYCCYLKGKTGGKEYKGCASLTKEEYDDIDKTIKALEDLPDSEIDKLDCKSYYIQFCLLSLLFVLL